MAFISGCLGSRRCRRRAASELIDGFEELDEAVTGIVDTTLRPLMVLEDIEAGSIRVWLSSFLKKIDDQGLREGEIKKAIGPALVEARVGVLNRRCEHGDARILPAAIACLAKDQNEAAAEIAQVR